MARRRVVRARNTQRAEGDVVREFAHPAVGLAGRVQRDETVLGEVDPGEANGRVRRGREGLGFGGRHRAVHLVVAAGGGGEGEAEALGGGLDHGFDVGGDEGEGRDGEGELARGEGFGVGVDLGDGGAGGGVGYADAVGDV